MKQHIGKPKVLAVDDYEANLTALEAVLSSDYQIITANSGLEAIAAVRRDPEIDVVLMDLQMPEMDGFEAAAEIKKIPEAQDLPIIFITAVYKDEPFVKRGYAVGGIDYFSKPFDPEILKLKLNIYASFRQRSEFLKSKEKQIKETDELLRVGRKLSAVLENLPVGVLISDVEGRICQINEQVSKILCKDSKPVHSELYGEMLGWWDTQGKMIISSGPLSKAMHEGITSRSERLQISCGDNAAKTILCSASPLLGLDNHIVGAVVVLQDVTETKKIEDDLEEQITKVVAAGVTLEESLSH